MTARRYLTGLRRKDPAAYRGIRGRWVANWPELVPIWQRVRDKADSCFRRSVYRRSWTVGPGGDAGVVCALFAEELARWAAEDRSQVASIRDAKKELEGLQARIRDTADALQDQIARVEELKLKHGLDVQLPAWDDDLATALEGAAKGRFSFDRSSAVDAFVRTEHQHRPSERLRVTDLIDAALFRFGAQVLPESPDAVAALRDSSGSSPDGETVQLRVLCEGICEGRRLGGWGPESAPGPLDWLSYRQLAILIRVFVGDGQPAPQRPWGGPSHGFNDETVRKAVRPFRVGVR